FPVTYKQNPAERSAGFFDISPPYRVAMGRWRGRPLGRVRDGGVTYRRLSGVEASKYPSVTDRSGGPFVLRTRRATPRGAPLPILTKWGGEKTLRIIPWRRLRPVLRTRPGRGRDADRAQHLREGAVGLGAGDRRRIEVVPHEGPADLIGARADLHAVILVAPDDQRIVDMDIVRRQQG